MALSKTRISSIDIVRGLLMVIMALDHVRDYFHTTAFVFDPTDLSKTTPFLFFTRWVTHFCAPGFVFLSGISIYLSLQRKPKKELSVFLLTRGVWLVMVELVVMRFALLYNFYFDVTIFGIIGVIGACMMLMAVLLFLHLRLLLLLGLIILFSYHLIPVPVLTSVGFISLLPDHALVVSYPIVPWLAIMILGYCAGEFYRPDVHVRRRKFLLLSTGVMAILLFSVLRFMNVFGDPSPWRLQKNDLFTFLSFLNVTKYPVSLLFSMITLGGALILLALLEETKTKIGKLIMVFGRVPLFYFVLHFFLIHTVALIFFMIKTGKSFAEIDFHFSKSFGGITPEGGFSLFWVYVFWVVLVIILYPICKGYDRYKGTHTYRWLSYL
jgi:uncharacterized membrane protein